MSYVTQKRTVHRNDIRADVKEYTRTWCKRTEVQEVRNVGTKRTLHQVYEKYLQAGVGELRTRWRTYEYTHVGRLLRPTSLK